MLSAIIWASLYLFAVKAAAGCHHSHKCWHRVSVKRHINWAWRHYRAHPMPRCTWVPESGAVRAHYSEFSRRRYRARNPGSTAGGKFQIIDRTWYGYGGSYTGDEDHPAAAASPLEQEKIARRVLAGQGVHAWVNC